MRKIFLVFIIFGLFSNCTNTQEVFKEEEFSKLNFGFDKKQKLKLNIKDKKKLQKFSNDLIDELDELINKEKKALVSVTLLVDSESNMIVFEEFKKTIKNSGLSNKSDPVEELMGACPDGWTNEGNCSSADCVKEKVAKVLSKIESRGDCWRVQVSRGWVSAKVCSQKC